MKPRIVSLIASATEIVSALGYQDCLVGRSHECDYPPDVISLPVCSEPRIDVSGTSREIDRAVKSVVRDALSVYSVFRHELGRLQPTHIITQTQCEVCAVNLRDVEAAVCDMVGSKPEIVSLEPMCLNDIWTDIRKVATSLGDSKAGARLVELLKSRLDEIAVSVASNGSQPTIFCLEWLQPLMSAGNWVPELVELAGGTSVLCQAGRHSPYLTWNDLRAVNPDIIVIMPCGFDVERTLTEIHLLTSETKWRELSAVRNRRVYVTDGNQYFNRPGPRVVESAEILAQILHSTSRSPSSAWQPLS